MVALAPVGTECSAGQLFSAYKAEGFSANQALYLTAAQLHQTPGDAPS